LPFDVLHQASAPLGMAVVPMPLVIATPQTPEQALYASPKGQPTPATKPVFRDASDFEYVLIVSCCFIIGQNWG
jgi:hypothetical protein